jgi:hypothetical protein
MIECTNSIQSSIQKSLTELCMTLENFYERAIELERIVKVSVLLSKNGLRLNNILFDKIEEKCLKTQKSDGGWIGVEDSLWITAFLKLSQVYFKQYENGLKCLKYWQLANGAWGKTNRDIGRIPTTGLLLYFLPELSNEAGLEWLRKEWETDFVLNSKLTYKGAFFLMGMKNTIYPLIHNQVIENTLSWLASEQNDDFGWGPWRGHPVGSSPFCTGVALIGLLQYPDLVDRQVIVNGLEWIQKKQLPNGLWPDHYIEEGSAWCFYALTEGYKFLKGSQ